MKKLLCIILAVFMVLSTFAIPVFAEDAVEEPATATGVLHFDANSTGWETISKVYCHIWAYGGDGFFPWKSKKQVCTDTDGDGVWTYDLEAKGVNLEVGQLYAVIFAADNDQTYNLLFDSTVLGDTAYCDETKYENPEDSSQLTQAAFWKNQDAAVFGPEMCITSIGNVVGTCIPSVTTAQTMLEDLLLNTDKVDNIRTYSLKEDQAIVDDIAIALGLTLEEVEAAVANTASDVAWTAEASTVAPAEKDEPTTPAEPEFVTGTLNFDANTTGWETITKVYCHIWAYGGDGFFPWKSKKQVCTDTDGDGVWTYDLEAKGVELEVGKLYAVIFAADNDQTYNLLFDSTVLGDTAYCDGTMYENPEDSSQLAQAAFWRGQDASVFGPEMCVTSIGNVVGTCIPSVTTAQTMFENFLLNTLENARVYSGKDDQTLLDDTAIALGLTIEEVEAAIANTGVVVEWTAENSTIGAEPELEIGDVDGNGQVEILDATAIQLYLAKLAEFDEAQAVRADTTKDGAIEVLDATRIQLYIAKLVDTL